MLLLLACLRRISWERRQLRTEYYRYGAGSRSLRIAFLSDLHDFGERYGIDRLAEAVLRENPDLILYGGDMLTCMKDGDWGADPADVLRLTKKLGPKVPVLYAEGNHEARLRMRQPEIFAAFKAQLDSLSVDYLWNRTLETGGIAISGITLEEEYYRRRTPGFGNREPMPADCILKKLGMPAKGKINLLLMHSPLYLEEAAAWGADLVLSGHFHGGTIRLPLPGRPGLMTPQYQFFETKCSGEHVAKNHHTRMIVSRGLGTHSVPIRLKNLPELAIIDVYL